MTFSLLLLCKKFPFLFFAQGICLFSSTFLIYYLLENRDLVDSFYGACMLLSLLGQDDAPELEITKCCIAFLSLISGLFYIVWVWIYHEEALHTFDTRGTRCKNIKKTMCLGLVLFFIALLTYRFVEERTWQGSFFGTCMLLAMIGQDDKPETISGQLVIGSLSLLSSFVFAVWIWVIIEREIRRWFFEFDTSLWAPPHLLTPLLENGKALGSLPNGKIQMIT